LRSVCRGDRDGEKELGGARISGCVYVYPRK
jgi:hypothetical protein